MILRPVMMQIPKVIVMSSNSVLPQHYYCTIMHRQIMDTKIHYVSLRGVGLPQVTPYRGFCLTLHVDFFSTNVK